MPSGNLEKVTELRRGEQLGTRMKKNQVIVSQRERAQCVFTHPPFRKMPIPVAYKY